MSSIIVTPDEIVMEIRRRYPTEAVFRPPPPRRPEFPVFMPGMECLYALPVCVYRGAETVSIGQYLRHSVYERDGTRYWLIEVGKAVLYGETRDGAIIPFMVQGFPTPFAELFVRAPEFREYIARFLLEVEPRDYFECREDQIINLTQAMECRSPFLLVDKYDLIRFGVRDPEIASRIAEQQHIIDQLSRALYRYESTIRDLQTSLSVLNARVARYQELLTVYEDRLRKATEELAHAQAELIRIGHELSIRAIEAEALEESRKRMQDIVDRLLKILSEIMETRETIERARR